MSTRGCVAIRQADGSWRGVYNHHDSYPTGLGKDLWDYLQGADLAAFARDLLMFTDWRDYRNCGVCPYCGGLALGQPHSIRADIASAVDGWSPNEPKPWVQANVDRTGYPDPEARYHGHDLDEAGDVTDAHITSDNPDPLFMEWVYVLDPEARTVDVLDAQKDDSHPTEHRDTHISDILDEPYVRADGFTEYGHCAYRHVRVWTVDLDGPEPDWEAVECGPNLERCPHYNWVHDETICRKCNGDGTERNGLTCPECDGSGQRAPVAT